MLEREISKGLRIIGIGIIVLSIIGSLIICFAYESVLLLILGSLSGCISGICFIAFSKIIVLLEENICHQKEIIDILKDISSLSEEHTSPKTLLQDIESNLPEI